MHARAVLSRRLILAVVLIALSLAALGTLTADAGSTTVPSGVRGHGVRYGIDVSHWQGRIAWHRVRNSGVRFAIAKATDGRHMVDGSYHRNSRMARRAGIAFTAYHFARPGLGIADARAQADFFVRHAKLLPGDLVPALDLERAGGLSTRALQRWVMAFLLRVEQRLGVKPMIYTSPGFWTGSMGNTREFARAGFRVLWVAHWGTARPSVPARQWNGNGWTIWQWTKCGRVGGIDGCVDRDALSGVRLKSLTIAHQLGH